MIQERALLCGKCSKTVPISQIRYVMRSRGLPTAMCGSCRDEGTLNRKSSAVKPREEIRKLFMCTSCSYKFQFNTLASSGPRCPLCGKGHYVEEYKDSFADDSVRSL